MAVATARVFDLQMVKEAELNNNKALKGQPQAY